MNSYIKIFDELPRSENIKYTFTGRSDTFLIYAFLKNNKISPLGILTEINLMASKLGVCDFWMKKSIDSHEESVADYEDHDAF